MAYDVTKLTKLSALKALAEKVQSDYATKTTVSNLEARINEIVATGGEPNAINKILVNGVEQTISGDKGVDITVPTKVSEISNDSKYQTDTQVAASIQAAIAATGHATFVKVDAVPTADAAEDNVLYLVMNSKTKHYDIYAKVGTEVLLIDDTTVDLTAYSTTEQMNTAISEAIAALNIGQYATVTVVNGVITRVEALEGKVTTLEEKVSALETKDTELANADTALGNRIKDLEDVGATKVEKSDTNGNIKIDGVETVVYTEPSDVVHGSIATDAEVTEMLNEVFAAE